MKLCNFCCAGDPQAAAVEAVDRRGAGRKVGDNMARRVVMIEYEYQLPGTGLFTFRRESFSVHCGNTAEELIDLILDSFDTVYSSSVPFHLKDRRGCTVLDSENPTSYTFDSLIHGATLTMFKSHR
eukprot:TRINITY_DN1218_c1_g1_i1.p1 TRINITY_DN1218_c1_g1~~TRINITY_DN1218_c1_g1_i1.p1  ORF type:complete len:126 (+),score=5.51 TRINITY_DN1218_c1_g1_i1:69-446(+)